MTRPTRGREASTPTRHHPDPFPSVLATALDRTARGARPLPHPGLAAVPAHGAGPVVVPAAAVQPAVAVVRGRAAGRPHRIALVPGTAPERSPRTGDTPDASDDHLIETVEPDARQLWREFLQRREPATRRRVIEHHAALVRGVGAKLAVRLPSSIELSDLVQAGTFGLMEAVDRFDPTRGVRFEGYAAQRIRGAMLDELRSQDWVPRTVRARTREVERARETLHVRLGRPATDRELAAELGIGVRELRAATRPVHLVSTDDADGSVGAAALAAVVPDDTDPYLAAVRRETSAELRAAIGQLGDRDRLVLQLYYLEDRTLAEIGAVLGVTESRVCQLHARMVTRLRGRLDQALAG